jgi:uncharacterized protein (DUF433 family)
MNLPDFLTDHPDGEIRLTGHRIGLYHVISRHAEGCSPEMLHEEYPTLPLPLIHNVIAFYQDNRDEVDAYISAYGAELARQQAAHRPSPAAQRIRRNLEAKSRCQDSELRKSS